MNATFDFTGRAVFVAGGTSGINLGIARAFARAGARLGVAGALGAVGVLDAADALVADRVTHGRRAAALGLVLRGAHDAAAVVEIAHGRLGVDFGAGGIGIRRAIAADARLLDAERLVGVGAVVVASAASRWSH